MSGQHIDVSSFFHRGRSGRGRHPVGALVAEVLEPALGTVTIEEIRDTLRMRTADGGVLDVHRSDVEVVGQWLNWLKADWNGERVLMEFPSVDMAIRAGQAFQTSDRGRHLEAV